jgi:hypothetical protein
VQWGEEPVPQPCAGVDYWLCLRGRKDRNLGLADPHLGRVDENDGMDEIQRSDRPSAVPSMPRSVIVVIVCFEASAP